MNLLAPVNQDPSFQWNEKTARHLFNRAGFGVPSGAISRLASMRPDAAVGAFVDFEHLPDVGPPAPEIPERLDYRAMREKYSELSEAERRKMFNDRRREQREALVDLQVWWLTRMCRSQRPLHEKLVLFWHGHFATSAEKVQDAAMNLELNEIFRNQGAGNFTELVRAVGKSPAMLRYLDQQQSSKAKPNENWARELLELFTLGIGNYTEQDIKEAARAFTGWTQRDGEFFFAPHRHDYGMKAILGTRAKYNGDQVVDLITSRPACAQFICTKLWKHFAYDDPEPEVIAGLAETWRQHNGNIRPVLRQMFLSRAFYQEKAYFSQVKSPAQLVAGLMVQLGAEDEQEIGPIAAYAMRAMGQSLFYPPNVKGWDGGRAWINTNTLLVRYNFSNFLVSGIVPDLEGQRGAGNIRRQFLMAAMGRKTDAPAEGSMMGGGGMMGPPDDDDDNQADGESMGPAGQDAMPRDIPAKTFYKKLYERGAKNQRYRGLSKEERREAMMLDGAMDMAPFDARGFFLQYKGKPAAEMVDALAAHFIGFSLDDNQRARLITILGQSVESNQPVPVEKMAEEDLRATIQLMLSTVEYQVC